MKPRRPRELILAIDAQPIMVLFEPWGPILLVLYNLGFSPKLLVRFLDGSDHPGGWLRKALTVALT